MISNVNRHQTHQKQHQAPFGHRIFMTYMSNFFFPEPSITVTKPNLFFLLKWNLKEHRVLLLFWVCSPTHQEAVRLGVVSVPSPPTKFCSLLTCTQSCGRHAGSGHPLAP